WICCVFQILADLRRIRGDSLPRDSPFFRRDQQLGSAFCDERQPVCKRIVRRGTRPSCRVLAFVWPSLQRRRGSSRLSVSLAIGAIPRPHEKSLPPGLQCFSESLKPATFWSWGWLSLGPNAHMPIPGSESQSGCWRNSAALRDNRKATRHTRCSEAARLRHRGRAKEWRQSFAVPAACSERSGSTPTVPWPR